MFQSIHMSHVKTDEIGIPGPIEEKHWEREPERVVLEGSQYVHPRIPGTFESRDGVLLWHDAIAFLCW